MNITFLKVINRFMLYKLAEVPLFQAYAFINIDTVARFWKL
jgi:hypothetical protein